MTKSYERIKELAIHSPTIAKDCIQGILEIPKPPLLVYFRIMEWLQEPFISIVGTRANSSQGQRRC